MWLAHIMFGEPILMLSTKPRAGAALLLSEFVATFSLIAAILVCVRFRPDALAGVVAALIGGAYWFAASTSFANPAVTVARALTDTFAGIRRKTCPDSSSCNCSAPPPPLSFARRSCGAQADASSPTTNPIARFRLRRRQRR